jgi:hypothetical protein
MPRIRIHFSKTGYACFISHVDLPTLFGRSARRAGLIPEQTQGFSPHARHALCPPLPVGVVALREPADFWFSAWDPESMERWRRCLPDGIDIVDAREVDGASLNKLCTAAEYSIEPADGGRIPEIAGVIGPLLDTHGALRDIAARERSLLVSAGDLERCGVSRMVKELISEGVVSGWSELRISRTAVGAWSAEKHRVIPLTEDF